MSSQSRLGSPNEPVLIASKVACRKCHARKVKCPGGRPCSACVQLRCETECIYPKRDKQIKISQSYLEDLRRENRQLRNRLNSAPREDSITVGVSATNPPESPVSTEEPSQNPLLDDKPWFLAMRSASVPVPILIGEVADAAFATRFRQVLTRSTLNHIPRIDYPGVDQISELACYDYPKPSPTQARFLIRTAMANIDGYFHIVRKSDISTLLTHFLQSQEQLDPLSVCKMLALFALGELYSSHCVTGDRTIPGLIYFSHAQKAYGRLLERPCVECIEIALLLCLYSLCINRRHSAYFLASSAIRHGVVMGLHFNLPEAQLNDNVVREHLTRIWWTSYVLEHTCAMISSQIVSISDDEIFVDLPTKMPLSSPEEADFENTECVIARIQLAKQTRKIIKSLYGRGKESQLFLHRVQQALKDLKQWHQSLPETLSSSLDAQTKDSNCIRSLDLVFHHCMILITRPILLYLLRLYKQNMESHAETVPHTITENVRTVAETCVRCARHIYNLTTESWIEGTFKTFDYFKTQYLFSVATILAIASLLGGPNCVKDKESFDFASTLIEKLKDSGSLCAVELYQHIQAIKAEIEGHDSEIHVAASSNWESVESEEISFLDGPSQANHPSTSTYYMSGGGATLSEPSLQTFLLQSEPDLGQIDLLLDETPSNALYWPLFES